MTVPVWTLVLLFGLFPDTVFYVMREMAHVPMHMAFTNTPWFITLSCAGFLGWFTYERCREGGAQEDIAVGKAVQITVLALAAFLPIQVERLPAYLHIPIPLYRNLILAVIAIKMTTWLYLMQLIMRYYMFSGLDVFRNMPLFFPSALESFREHGKPAEAPPDSAQSPDSGD